MISSVRQGVGDREGQQVTAFQRLCGYSRGLVTRLPAPVAGFPRQC